IATDSIAADGTVTFGGGYLMSGALSANGSVLLMSNASRSGETPEFAIGLRKGGTFTTASLSGSYFYQGYRNSSAGPVLTPAAGSPLPDPYGFAVRSGTMTFDGVGGLTFTPMQNRDGTVSALGGGIATYSVAADGTVTFAGGYAMSGMLSADGSVLLMSNADQSGEKPELAIGIRKAGAFTTASLS